jgi:hypothetical protein
VEHLEILSNELPIISQRDDKLSVVRKQVNDVGYDSLVTDTKQGLVAVFGLISKSPASASRED